MIFVLKQARAAHPFEPIAVRKYAQKAFNTALFDAANNADAGIVWFATPDNKVLGCLGRNLIQTTIGEDGVLVFFANDNAPVIRYLESTLKPG